ncbi:glycoside hydrolase [Choiromyces venosus 120613-1]|uniref:Glycoside hydrolase n=1 Tax=Choiromyces venosus 120613-1 TaxID=1336337 RepID=A0A3N4JVY9_9PEZI|nr:glycoside hydrolase [Choiromyces venosus 120613-1]
MFATDILKVAGTKILGKDGNEVFLRGVPGVGGWMNMENFITGDPGREFQIRQALKEVLGEDKSKFFFDKFLEYFFTESDAKFYKSLGLNCTCQNGDWHADIARHDRSIWLWEKLAEHFKGNPWIAGYSPLNEPVYEAIRKIDGNHILFLDGNTFASDFSHSDVKETCGKWENTVYSVHDYSNYGFPSASEVYTGAETQKAKLGRGYQRKVVWMKQNNLPIWNGEFGPVYARKMYDGADTDKTNESRTKLLDGQLKIYDEDRISWSIWLYKDIGYQGMVYINPETAYMKLFKEFLEKKFRLAVDAWGADDSKIRDVYEPFEKFIGDNVDPKYRDLYPAPVWKFDSRISRISRNILLAEFMVKEWAGHFTGMDEAQLDEIAQSFKFENCLTRETLDKVLVAHKSVGKKFLFGRSPII